MAKQKRITAKYEPGFLQRLDRRTEIAKILNTAYDEVTSDMGGIENLSHSQLALAERFVFLEYVLRTLEDRIVNEPKHAAALLGRWIQGLNSFIGLAKTIGLERRAKKIECLQTYITGNKNGKRQRSKM